MQYARTDPATAVNNRPRTGRALVDCEEGFHWGKSESRWAGKLAGCGEPSWNLPRNRSGVEPGKVRRILPERLPLDPGEGRPPAWRPFHFKHDACWRGSVAALELSGLYAGGSLTCCTCAICNDPFCNYDQLRFLTRERRRNAAAPASANRAAVFGSGTAATATT